MKSLTSALRGNPTRSRQIAVLAVMVAFLCSCSREKIDYEASKKKATVESYTEFVKKYPAGRLTEEAKFEIIRIQIDDAKKAQSTTEFRRILAAAPAPSLRTIAETELANLHTQRFAEALQLLTEGQWSDASKLLHDLGSNFPEDTRVGLLANVSDYFLDAPGISSAAFKREDLAKVDIEALLGNTSKSAFTQFLRALSAQGKSERKRSLELLGECRQLAPSDPHYGQSYNVVARTAGELKFRNFSQIKYSGGQQQTKLVDGATRNVWTKLPDATGMITSAFCETETLPAKGGLAATIDGTELIPAGPPVNAYTSPSGGFSSNAGYAPPDTSADTEKLAFRVVSGALIVVRPELERFLNNGIHVLSHPDTMVRRYDFFGDFFIVSIDPRAGQKYLCPANL